MCHIAITGKHNVIHKSGVNNILHCHQRRTIRQPKLTSTENFAKFGWTCHFSAKYCRLELELMTSGPSTSIRNLPSLRHIVSVASAVVCVQVRRERASANPTIAVYRQSLFRRPAGCWLKTHSCSTVVTSSTSKKNT